MTNYQSIISTDALTGLTERDPFLYHTERMLAVNEGADQPVSLLLFDLDQLKSVNATSGHATGDEVLRLFAQRLSRLLRLVDIAGRIDGEEFAAVLPGCGSGVALAIAEQVRAAFQDDAHFVNGHTVGATVSVGVATADGPAFTLAGILGSASNALSRAKTLGGNRVALAESMPQPERSPRPGACRIGYPGISA